MTLSVSYLWMQKDSKESNVIPSHLFCRLQQNAKRYPDTPFDLWVESPRASEPYAIPQNVTIYDLNSIPAFSRLPIMSSPDPTLIWAKVDIARLLVLQHELGELRRDTAVYSDMDVKDILIKSDPFTKRIKKYGMAVGSVINKWDEVSHGAENGYFAFTVRRSEFLDSLIHATTSAATEPSAINLKRSTIYVETFTFFKRRAKRFASSRGDQYIPLLWRAKIAGLGVLPPCGYSGDAHLVAEPVRPDNSKPLVVSIKATA